MQAKSTWISPEGTLGRLVKRSFERTSVLERSGEAFDGRPKGIPSMFDALSGSSTAIIAEIKRRSPSKGDIRPEIDAGLQAKAYQKGGAAAISVLTEPDSFGGRSEDLNTVRSCSTIPLLKKDFHVSEIQLAEARHLGASAALIIVRALPPQRIFELATHGRSLELELIFEVRDESELDIALNCDARIIGVNNRNLETLEIDSSTSQTLIPRIPASCIAIAESGYLTRHDIEAVARAGADAVLIGSSVSAASDPESAVRALAGVSRTPRAI